MSKLRMFDFEDLDYIKNPDVQKDGVITILQKIYSYKEYLKYIHTKINIYRGYIDKKETSEIDRIYYIGKLDALEELLKDINWAIKQLTKK